MLNWWGSLSLDSFLEPVLDVLKIRPRHSITTEMTLRELRKSVGFLWIAIVDPEDFRRQLPVESVNDEVLLRLMPTCYLCALHVKVLVGVFATLSGAHFRWPSTLFCSAVGSLVGWLIVSLKVLLRVWRV